MKKTSELKTIIESGLRVRRNLIRLGRSRTDLRDLFPKVVYWVGSSGNIEKTAKNRRVEILLILPPNMKKRFNELMEKI